jgi:hypothetical protein
MIEASKEVDERRQGSRMFLFAQTDSFTLSDPARLFRKAWRNGRDNELVSLLD